MYKVPQRDLVVIRADQPKERTTSGLYVNEEWKTLPPTGEVLAVGPLVKLVKPSDRVVFDRYGSMIMENDERICKESHILAVIEDESV